MAQKNPKTIIKEKNIFLENNKINIPENYKQLLKKQFGKK
jgi:phosphorylcholine metabolism protein LicD